MTIDSYIKKNFGEILGGHSEYNKEKEESDKMREVILVSSKTVTLHNFDSHNVSIYGTIRDSGILSRTAGVFSDRDYAVSELKKSSVVSLTHKVHWQYSSAAALTVNSVQRDTEALAYTH